MTVQFWEHGRYLRANEPGPSVLIDLSDLDSYAIRDTVQIKGHKVWVTVLRKQVHFILVD